MILHMDIETYSSLWLPDVGVYAYAASPDFRVLMLAYAFDERPVQIVDLALGEVIPPAVLDALEDPAVTKMAHNAQFERVCLSAHVGHRLLPINWYCTAVHAAACGLPLDLATATRVMLPEAEQKDAVGKRLIRYFCSPCPPTVKNGHRTRNLPGHAPADWAAFKQYCVQDVVAERALEKKLERFPLLPVELELYALDQEINDRGVRVDPPLVYSAIKADNNYKSRMVKESIELTGMDNPKSVSQLKAWLLEENGIEVDSLNKKSVPALIKATDCAIVTRVLEIRQELAKTSVKKYEAMARALGPENRVRGLLQFYGAGRTGRWSGRLVQVQNLPQNHLPDLDYARRLVREGDTDTVEMLFPSLPVVLSELIRTAFIPRDGHRFVVADFSAIEARVISWLAGEEWRLEVFRTHGKIYEASASQMFGVPIAQITKTSPLRQRGKVAELALGYQGGVNAMVAMGAVDNGVPVEELPGIVSRWRKANPSIVKLWRILENAAISVLDGEPSARGPRGLKFFMKGPLLRVQLPSGRCLSYYNARLEPHSRFEGKTAIVYEGIGQERKSWGRLDTYGGKITENVVQAVARDILAESMLRLEAAGYRIVMHVHDEAVLEVPLDQAGALEEACAIMGQSVEWAPGLPLRADGFECLFYKKD